MISFRKVQVKTTVGKVLLHETSFEIPAGRVVGVFGPNGSGKTTLLKVVAGQTKDREIAGENWVDASSIFHGTLSTEEKAKKILYLGSDFQTPFQISVRELLEMAKRVNPSSHENSAAVAEHLKLLHYFLALLMK